MQDYTEMYASNLIRLYGAYDEEILVYSFRVEMDEYFISGWNFGFSGSALFYLLPNVKIECCKELRQMYDSLTGECIIRDCEFGNELKLFFEGRQLKIEGKFDEGDNRVLMFSEDVDQTIIPPIISLLQNN